MKEWDDDLVAGKTLPKTPEMVYEKSTSKVKDVEVADIEAQKGIRKPRRKGGSGKKDIEREPSCSCEDPLASSLSISSPWK